MTAQWSRTGVVTMRMWVRSLASLRGLRIAMSCGVGHKHGLDPALLWLRCRPAAVAPIRPLAWELPCAGVAALKSKKKKVEIPYFSWTHCPSEFDQPRARCPWPLCWTASHSVAASRGRKQMG